MLAHFCVTQQGESHVQRGDACQDHSTSRSVVAPSNGKEYVVAAIADGVGSCELSDQGSRAAAETFVDHVAGSLGDADSAPDGELVGALVEEAFHAALARVAEMAREQMVPAPLFDTTLTGIVYDGHTMWYGHAGDDGIVAMRADGGYGMVTSRHEGEEAGSVCPLRSMGTWEFGAVDNVASLVMMTDGLLDYCVGGELGGNRVYLPFLQPLLYGVLSSPEEADAAMADWEEFLAGTQPCSDAGGGDDADGEGEAAEGEPDAGTADERAATSFRLRDHVRDDMTLVLVENPDAVASLPPYGFDLDAYHAETERIRAEVREGLRASSRDRLAEWEARHPARPTEPSAVPDEEEAASSRSHDGSHADDSPTKPLSHDPDPAAAGTPLAGIRASAAVVAIGTIEIIGTAGRVVGDGTKLLMGHGPGKGGRARRRPTKRRPHPPEGRSPQA